MRGFFQLYRELAGFATTAIKHPRPHTQRCSTRCLLVLEERGGKGAGGGAEKEEGFWSVAVTASDAAK